MLEEAPLDPERHDRAGFFCGVPALDDYLHRFAVQHIRKGVTTVHVLVDDAAPADILGYYTLSAAEVDSVELRPGERKRLPRYPVPCFRLGRLACRADRRGMGLGKLLLAGAVERCLRAKQQVAAYALIVDAKNDAAAAFYRHYGFVNFAGNSSMLYLPLGN
ncbi:MAG: GCN5-like N-acetyltransferase [Rhodocyclaceae bacterium]|nr:MAG: GCN5-like N-acetyltransferase [Rhodocyclaceae bacterium]TND02045.1 MAG: GCN5-like N-acetyltransferase [Rhodocyclaceae bacterium]